MRRSFVSCGDQVPPLMCNYLHERDAVLQLSSCEPADPGKQASDFRIIAANSLAKRSTRYRSCPVLHFALRFPA